MTYRSPAARVAGVAAIVMWLITVLGYAASAAPTSSAQRVQRGDIYIAGDSQFNPANGVRSGSGTKKDPFVISDWSLSNLTVKDTSAHLVVRDNTIQRLVLDWNGPGVTVVDNEVGDLRVNQNVRRTGAATGGLIANNRFGRVGQLRHFDGIFENNVVKPSSMALPLFSRKAVQFDGFHGSRFRNNTIYGFVDVKLHGHHHGSSFDEGSHHHAPAPASGGNHEGHEEHAAAPAVDHTRRYHEVFISNNVIYADGGYALRYTDRAHAGDDRTAPSETNPALNANHIHFTRIHLVGNELKGAGLMIDVFNADDSRHTGTERGLVAIRDNKIDLERNNSDYPWTAKDGISVKASTDANVRVVRNTVVGESPEERDLLDQRFSADAGILLYDLDLANVYLDDNKVGNMLYGVRASHMTGTVEWSISGLSTSAVTHPVYWDDSVKNSPRRRP